MVPSFKVSALVAAAFATIASAQTSCSSAITPAYSAPVVAKGYSSRIVANGFTRPRSIIFDTEGHLLVVQGGVGITALTFKDDGGNCLSVSSRTTVVNDTSLNHGIEFSADGKFLYASSSDKVFRWDYDAKAVRTTSNPLTLVQGMDNDDHTTRTLLLSKKVPNLLLVSRGSQSNIDVAALEIDSGHSQIKSFDISNSSKTYDYATEGTIIGWGLRNSVGVAEEPTTGSVWSVENSVDDIVRDRVDIHENNPGEELNFHGYLNGTRSDLHGKNYGYPNCYAVWNKTEIPNSERLDVGTQFAMGTQNSSLNDGTCASNAVSPRLTFPAHWAPLDIKFNSKGTVAYITSHGSWNRDRPDGYLLFAVSFKNGQPTEPANSIKAPVTILSNANNARCPNGCFRPVGLAWDSKGRLFMTSDRSGEIFVIGKTDGKSVDSQTLDGMSPITGTNTTAQSGASSVGGKAGWSAALLSAVTVGILTGFGALL